MSVLAQTNERHKRPLGPEPRRNALFGSTRKLSCALYRVIAPSPIKPNLGFWGPLNYVRLFRSQASIQTNPSMKKNTTTAKVMVFLVYARQHIAVAIQPALWCFAPLLTAMSTAFANIKCKRLCWLHLWSEWRDLNSRPLGPEPSALPNCATPRKTTMIILGLLLFCKCFGWIDDFQ